MNSDQNFDNTEEQEILPLRVEIRCVVPPTDEQKAKIADFVRETYQIPADVQIVAYKGKLSNRGETIAVKEPYSKETDANDPTATKYFYIWHDATLYSDGWEGLAEADGYGFSLQRVDTSTMGYEANAWKAVKPTPGTL